MWNEYCNLGKEFIQKLNVKIVHYILRIKDNIKHLETGNCI